MSAVILRFPDRDPERTFRRMATARYLEAVLCHLDGDEAGYSVALADVKALDERASLAREEAEQRRERLAAQFETRLREDRAVVRLITLVRRDLDAG